MAVLDYSNLPEGPLSPVAQMFEMFDAYDELLEAVSEDQTEPKKRKSPEEILYEPVEVEPEKKPQPEPVYDDYGCGCYE
jgi:hypothetical protein